MSNVVKIRMWVTTDRVGSKSTRLTEVDREDWESFSDVEKDQMLSDEVWRIIEWGWEEIK